MSQRGENYEQYNSLFKHYQRTHPIARNNDNKTAIVIDPSRTNSLTSRNNDDNNDDKTAIVIDSSRTKSLTSRNNDNKRVAVKKNNNKTYFLILFFVVGILSFGILYKKGFFEPLLERLGLVTQKQRSIFI